MEKILFDTDIGTDIDDALALAYLLCEPRCQLLGVTTVSGEAELRASLASAICRNMGRDDIPIHVGCHQALLIDTPQKRAAQASALDNWPHQTFAKQNTAIEFMRRTIRDNPGEVTLLAVGPLTNVALLLASDPEIATLLKALTLMCGRFFNAPGGEWNAVCDPHAAAIVYGNGWQAKPERHVSFGLDVTQQVTLARAEARQRLSGIKSLAPVRDFAEVWFARCEHVTFHDPLAAVCTFYPEICTYETKSVEVSLATPTLGWTVAHSATTEPAQRLACTVDAAAFFNRYFATVRQSQP